MLHSQLNAQNIPVSFRQSPLMKEGGFQVFEGVIDARIRKELLDEAVALDALAASPMGIIVERTREKIERGSYPPAFKLALASKDLGLAAGLFAAVGQQPKFWGLILPHGMLELTAVFVAGVLYGLGFETLKQLHVVGEIHEPGA